MSEPKNKLNLNPIPKKQASAEEIIAYFYETMANCAIEISIALNKSAEIQQEILIELTDIKDNFNRMGLKEGWINQIDIEERENDEGPENE